MTACIYCDPYWFPRQDRTHCFFCKAIIGHVKALAPVPCVRKQPKPAPVPCVRKQPKKPQRTTERERVAKQAAPHQRTIERASAYQRADALIEKYKDANTDRLWQAELIANLIWGVKQMSCYWCNTRSIRGKHTIKYGYQCGNCHSGITPLKCTIFYKTKISLKNWIIIYEEIKKTGTLFYSGILAGKLQISITTMNLVIDKITQASPEELALLEVVQSALLLECETVLSKKSSIFI